MPTSILKKSLLFKSTYTLCFALFSVASIPTHAINEYHVDFVAKAQTNEVAFVPFAGDRGLVSSVIMNDLNSTELKVTNKNLPQQAHSSTELTATLPKWKQLGIPYLVVGGTRSSGGKVYIDFEVIDVMSGRVLEGKQTYTSDTNSQKLRDTSHIIADKVYEIITGNPGDFSGRIAYIEETGKGKNKTSALKVMDADGNNAVTIFSDRVSIFSPAWSPDGRRLAYAVQRPMGLPVIYVQNVDGGQPTPVTPFPGNNLSPSFSPDGRSILFSSSFEGNADIYKIDIGSPTPQKLVSFSSNEVQPAYAPDGKSFLFVSDRVGENQPQIYQYHFNRNHDKIHRISRSGYATTPSFSPDGTQIGFLNGRSAAVMKTSGEVIKNFGNTSIDEAPSFSPNGQRVVYASGHGNRGIINIRSLNGGEHIRKSARGIVRSPVWSNKPQ